MEVVDATQFRVSSNVMYDVSQELLTDKQHWSRDSMLKVTHNTCSLHLVSNFQNFSKHTKPSIENSTRLW